MYEAFYKLTSNPFRLVPDPGFCFRHRGYAQAWAYLRYALQQAEGFILITGRPGIGKTTLISEFLSELESTGMVAISITATNFEATDLIRAVAYAWGINVEGLDRVTLERRITQFLQQQRQHGKRAVLIIDEAQGLSYPALEELRLLSDLQTGSSPLLQVFLVGQEKLQRVMSVPELEQLQQRVIGTCFLESMDIRETSAYMEHRLRRVGWRGDPELTGGALLVIYEYSRGVPRHINKIGNRLLLYGSLKKKHELDRNDVLIIVDELRSEQLAPLGDEDEPPLIVKELEDGSLSLDELALQENASRNPVDSASAEFSAEGIIRKRPVESPPAWQGVEDQRKQQTRWLSKPVFWSGNAFLLSGALVVVFLTTLTVMMYRSGEPESLETRAEAPYIEPLAGPMDGASISADNGTAPVPMQVELSRLEPVAVMVASPGQQQSVSPAIEQLQPVDALSDLLDPQDDALELAEFTEQATDSVLALLLPPDRASGDTGVASGDDRSFRADAEPLALQESEDQVAEYLAQAGRALKQDRLLVPADNSAHYYYRKVLEQDSENSQALNGLDRIARRYLVLAGRAIERDDEKAAGRFVQRGLSVRPQNEQLLQMRDQLRADAEASVFQFTEAKQSGMQADSDALSGQEGFFSRLKNFFDSDKARVEQAELWEEETAW